MFIRIDCLSNIFTIFLWCPTYILILSFRFLNIFDICFHRFIANRVFDDQDTKIYADSFYDPKHWTNTSLLCHFVHWRCYRVIRDGYSNLVHFHNLQKKCLQSISDVIIWAQCVRDHQNWNNSHQMMTYGQAVKICSKASCGRSSRTVSLPIHGFI